MLVLDIETKKKDINKGVSAENAETVIWGAYSYNTGNVYFGRRRQSPQKLIDQHKVLITHNGKGFDIPVLQQDYDIKIWGLTHIDLLETFRKPPSRSEKESYLKKKKRPPTGKGREAIIGEARIIGMQDDRFPDYKLATIAKHGHKLFANHEIYSQYFNDYKDEDFPYEKLNDAVWVENNINYIKKYLVKDLVVTKNIFQFLERYFDSMIYDLPIHDIETLQYIHSPTGSYTYKCICKELRLAEEYDSETKREKFLGAKVFLPVQERYTIKDGDGYCIDFNSQHPSHIRMANLATPISKCLHKVNGKCPKPWNGRPIFRLKGTYCGCEQGKIEKLFTKWYIGRVKEKAENDPHEYTSKIKLNSAYGILSSPIFKSTYNKTTGPDTTLMSQDSLDFMATWMTKHGYILTYGDTDSLYIMDPFRNKAKMKSIMRQGIKQITDILPFADEYYDMGIDAEFTDIFFFEDEKSKERKFKKKNYIYLQKKMDKDDKWTGEIKVKINGLPILKKNAPKLAKLIYTKYLEKEIIRTRKIKFDKGFLAQAIECEIQKDINILVANIRVSPAGQYASESQMQAQISKAYFKGKDGIFKGIKHTRKGYGVGKGKFYCNMDEAKDLRHDEYDLQTVWKTLNPFVKHDKQLSLLTY